MDGKCIATSLLIVILVVIAVAGVGAYFLVTQTEEGEEAGGENQPSPSGWQFEGRRIANGWYWNPEVVQLDNGAFRMYVEDHGDGSTYNGIVGLSSTQGLNWTYEWVVHPSATHPSIVRLPGGSWRLYYQKISGETMRTGVGSAISDDGLTFEDEEGMRLLSDEALEGAYIRHPSVVSLPEGGYRMYYDTAENDAFIRIWSAYSEDGLTFTREGLGIDLTPLRDDWPPHFYAHASKPEVLRTPDGVWRMYFNSSPLIGPVYNPIVIRLATSSDGVDWTVKTDGYEIPGGDYPDGKVYSPFDCSVRIIDNESGPILRMWYSLFKGPMEESIVGEYSGIYSASMPLDNLSEQ